MGNQFNFFTIYVSPVDTSRENKVVKMVRNLEDNYLKGFEAPEHSFISKE